MAAFDVAHFERLYAAKADPWGYTTSPYEAAKYAATLAALPRPRYRRALDVGCSIGVLTAVLAPRCDQLVAVDPVAAALDQARLRLAAHPHVQLAAMAVPGDWPDGAFDLVLISEVLDYLAPDALAALAARLLGSLEPGGDLVLVHWVGKKGPVSSGHETTEILAGALRGAVVPVSATRNPQYRLDVFRRTA